MRIRMGAALLLALSNCTADIPVTVISSGAVLMTGTIRARDVRLNEVDLKVSGSGQDCSATFSWGSTPAVSAPVKCSDGRAGIVALARPSDGLIAGTGTISLSDGSHYDFVFGSK